jgi:hypothetical protein
MNEIYPTDVTPYILEKHRCNSIAKGVHGGAVAPRTSCPMGHEIHTKSMFLTGYGVGIDMRTVRGHEAGLTWETFSARPPASVPSHP